MIHTDIQNALNQQSNEYFQGWYFYRTGAAYCEEINLRGIASWMRERAEKKSRQATKVSDFLLQCRGHVEHQPILPPRDTWNSPLELIENAIELEQRLGESVGQIMNLALSSRDHSTHDFLEPFARDQAQAEGELDRVAERLKLVGDSPAGLFMLDVALV